MNQESQDNSKNTEFYENCAIYLEFLRKKGKNDDSFEDEYYFTMPAISNYQRIAEPKISRNENNTTYGFKFKTN